MGLDLRKFLIFKDNKRLWEGNKDGVFKVADLRAQIMKKRIDDPVGMVFIWNKWIPPKMKLF
ncbi:hypothetical protein HanIR_Chr03g0112981 [Helianthus annuus]|nr:hypothetical protein HanIR_Chr03g0112981 [Helianthus annuus]